ncbi:hypothetical protein NH340_JMT05639 [Sarcoptes scabiei]|nr:hypothetical protein NH340_JMT05639 [Sarcoptes scabiei]
MNEQPNKISNIGCRLEERKVKKNKDDEKNFKLLEQTLEDSDHQEIAVEDMILLNEMIKTCKSGEKIATKSSNTNIVEDHCIDDQDSIRTSFDKGLKADKILGITSMDNLNLLICYIVRFEDGSLELIPNKIAHFFCPQKVIEFLESKLIFSSGNRPEYVSKNRDETERKNSNSISSDNHPRGESSFLDQSDCDPNTDEDVYLLDELSDYLDFNDLKSMIPGNRTGNEYSISTKINNFNDSSDQINRLDLEDIIIDHKPNRSKDNETHEKKKEIVPMTDIESNVDRDDSNKNEDSKVNKSSSCIEKHSSKPPYSKLSLSSESLSSLSSSDLNYFDIEKNPID